MAMSYSATSPTTGTFLTPIPQAAGRRTEEETPAGPHQKIDFGDGIKLLAYDKIDIQTTFHLDIIYQTVANRRLAFDNMTWQVPILALSAHAFLFTISLDSDTTRTARIISMGLSFLVTILTARLFIGHMKREVSDRSWLAAFEKQYLPDICQTHIKGWKFRTEIQPKKAGWIYPLFMFPAFGIWRDGLMVIGGVALAVIGIAIWKPELLEGDGKGSSALLCAAGNATSLLGSK